MLKTNKNLTQNWICRLRARLSWLGLAVSIIGTLVLPVVRPGMVWAGQVTSRSIQMSSSAASAANTQYKVTFTLASTSTPIGGVVVDFCMNSPLAGDSCTTTNGANASGTSVNSQAGISGYAVDGASTANSVRLTNGTPATPSPSTVSFVLGNGTSNGITNPTTVGTFYARIYTYATQSAAQSHSVASPSGYVDYGGVALSTVNQLSITAKVQESLTFNLSASSLALGDSNGVLASTASTYTNTVDFNLASNAQGGVSVRMKGDTLKSGSNSITAHGGGTSKTCVADVATTSVEQFGMRISVAGSGVSPSTNTSTSAAYGCSSGQHNFWTDTTDGTLSTYGGLIATTSGATDLSATTMEFAAKAASTTEAGIYTTTLTFIATGVY